jgi:crotonobetainyl-CoA:carnitine CoA-transferase CaiB-like acyl-CoA transferase
MGHPDRSLRDGPAMTTSAHGAPLQGVRVLEMASYVTGPYASALLADMGADVIKVEERTRGDPFRGWGQGGISPTFRSVNRGKRSLAIDLRTAAGRTAVEALADRADVLVENYRPGVVERLGLGYEPVRARNLRIVYCSISGFGSSGPYRDRPGYDTVGQAMSGLLGLLTDLEAPKPMGISLSDHITGIFACTGILAALVGRAESGRGRRVETSLLQATTAFVAENAARYFEEGEVPTRATRARIAQAYAFVGGDGGPFVVHLSSPPKFWEGLTDAVGRRDLRDDPRFVERAARVDHYDELQTILDAIFASEPRQTWLDRLAASDVPAGPINTLDEVFEDPGVQALELVHTVVHREAGPMRLVGSGVTVEGHDERTVGPPPLLGEHNEAILGELGYTREAIERLRGADVI